MLYGAEGERSARGVCVCVGGGGGGDTVHWYAYTGICIYPAGRVSDFMQDFFCITHAAEQALSKGTVETKPTLDTSLYHFGNTLLMGII